MSVLFVAVPVALAFAISAVIAFLWASRSGQLDDLDTPPLRVLHDEQPQREAARGGRLNAQVPAASETRHSASNRRTSGSSPA